MSKATGTSGKKKSGGDFSLRFASSLTTPLAKQIAAGVTETQRKQSAITPTVINTQEKQAQKAAQKAAQQTARQTAPKQSVVTPEAKPSTAQSVAKGVVQGAVLGPSPKQIGAITPTVINTQERQLLKEYDHTPAIQSHAQRVAQRNDAAVRESFALRHPEMTGGEAGARTRAINTGWVRASVAKRKAQEEVDKAQRELSGLGWTPQDRGPLTGEYAKASGKLTAAKEALKKAESELGKWSQVRYFDRGQRSFDALNADPVAQASYSEIETAREDKAKLDDVVNYYRGDALYLSEQTDTIQGYEKELLAKYGLTHQDFYDTAMNGEATQALLDALSQMDAGMEKGKESLESSGKYHYQDMRGYAVRMENQKKRAKANEKTARYADEHPVVMTGASIFASPARFFDAFSIDWGQGEPGDPDYIPPTNGWGIGDAIDTTRGTVAQGIRDKFPDHEWLGDSLAFVYQTGTSIGDSALGVAMLGPGSAYLAGANAAVGGARDIIDRGGTAEQALWGGLARGAAEIAFEKVSVDQLLTHRSINGWKDWARETFKQGGVEASEEMCTEVANILSDAAIMGDRSEFNMSVEEYMASGMSREEAEKRAYLDLLGQVTLSGIGGGLSGMAMGGTKRGYEAYQTGKQGVALEQAYRAILAEIAGQKNTFVPGDIRALYQQGMEEYAKAGPLVEYMTKIVDDAQRTRQIREQYAEGFAAYDAEQGKNQIIQAEDGETAELGKTEAETELTRPDGESQGIKQKGKIEISYKLALDDTDIEEFSQLEEYDGELQVVDRFSPKEYVIKLEAPKISGVRGHFKENLIKRADRASLTEDVAQNIIDNSKLVLYQPSRGTLKFLSDDGYVVLNLSKEVVTVVPEKLRNKYKRYVEGM